LCAEIRLPTGDVYMANNSGPSTLPCGTPDVQLAGADCSAPTATYCSRSVTKECTMDNASYTANKKATFTIYANGQYSHDKLLYYIQQHLMTAS